MKTIMLTLSERKIAHLCIFTILLFILTGCSSSQATEKSVESVVSPTIQSEPLRTNTPTPERAPIGETSEQESETPGEAVKLYYNLPSTVLVEPTGLYASPNRGDLVVQIQIPVGETIYVMARNATSSHLRVVWNTGVGWVPVSFTDYNGVREKLNPLPVFTREPPACAIPLATQFSLNSNWTSNEPGKQRIAVVVDLFRSRFGDFPTSSIALTVNGAAIESSQRQIVERGQFTLKDVVLSLPGYIQAGDVIGYQLNTSSDEPLAFMATIFSIPDNCVWDTD